LKTLLIQLWKTKNPKVDLYLRVWKTVKHNTNMHWEPVESPQRKIKWMPCLQLCRTNIQKNSGRASEKARNHGSHLQWEVKQEMKQSLSCGKNTLQHCWTHQKTVKSVILWKSINSRGNFEGIDDLMCNSYKIKSLLHGLPLDRAAGKDGIFPEHILYADASVCDYLSSLFNVCLMHGKIPQECMQTMPLYLFAKTRMGT